MARAVTDPEIIAQLEGGGSQDRNAAMRRATINTVPQQGVSDMVQEWAKGFFDPAVHDTKSPVPPGVMNLDTGINLMPKLLQQAQGSIANLRGGQASGGENTRTNPLLGAAYAEMPPTTPASIGTGQQGQQALTSSNNSSTNSTRGQAITDPNLIAQLEGAPPKPSAFQRFGKYLPTAGAVGFGIAGAPTGLGAIPMAGLGAGLGESARQMIGRAIGEPSPQTSGEAAKKIGIEGGMGAIGEATGQVMGKLGGAAFKALPKFGQMMSGTPAKNLVKAGERGLAETYFPAAAKGMSREAAGSVKGAVEDKLLLKYFEPAEVAKIKLNKTGYANQVVEESLAKSLEGHALTPPEALKTIKAVDAVYRDTPTGVKVAPELAKLRKSASAVAAKAFPEFAEANKAAEATILKSQLSKPLRVNKTRPDEFSGFAGALGAMKPAALLASMPFSPLAFGLTTGALGSIKNTVNPLVGRAIQRALIQAGMKSARPDSQ